MRIALGPLVLGAKMVPIKKLGDGRSTGLGWLPLNGDTQQLTKRWRRRGGGGVGEAMLTGGTREGGPLPMVSGDEMRGKKFKIERATGPRISMAPAGWEDTTTNRKAAVSLGGGGEYKKIDAFNKLINFFAGLDI